MLRLRAGSAVVREISLQTMILASMPRPSPPYSSGTSNCHSPSSSTLGRSRVLSSFCSAMSLTTSRTSGISSRSTKLGGLALSRDGSSASSKSMVRSLLGGNNRPGFVNDGVWRRIEIAQQRVDRLPADVVDVEFAQFHLGQQRRIGHG